MSRAKMREFLRAKAFLAEDLDLEAELCSFQEQIREGLKSGGKGLPMLPSFLRADADVPPQQPVIVIDAGGTNFRICLLSFSETKEAVIEHFRNFAMPGSREAISGTDFYRSFAEAVLPLLKYSRRIGFCFSYPSEIYPDKDGKILPFTKEIKAPDVVGTMLGAELRKALRLLGDSGNVDVVVLNDTVAALLGSFGSSQRGKYSDYIGVIWGTGVNLAYIETMSKIEKISGLDWPSARMIINAESGTLRVAARGPSDLALDAATINPGHYLFEKMISGRYLGPQCYFTLQAAVREEGLFSPQFCEAFASIEGLGSEEADAFLCDPLKGNELARACYDGRDREHLYYLIDNIMERAAALVCTMITAFILQSGSGRSPIEPVAVTMEGSTFYKSLLLRRKLDYYTRSFMNEKKEVYAEYLQVERANLVGTAIAALLN